MIKLVTPAEAQEILDKIRNSLKERPKELVEILRLLGSENDVASDLAETVIALWPFLEAMANLPCLYAEVRLLVSAEGKPNCPCLPHQARKLLGKC